MDWRKKARKMEETKTEKFYGQKKRANCKMQDLSHTITLKTEAKNAVFTKGAQSPVILLLQKLLQKYLLL